MRTKSFPVKRRCRSLHRLPKPSVLAVSSMQDEADEEDSLESHEPNALLNSNTEVEIVPDSFDDKAVPPKKYQSVGNGKTSKGLDSLNLDACIVCGVADDHALPCSGIDCPISFHRKCVNSEPENEDITSCYCPYCWFKNQVLRSKALREKAVMAEKALLDYIGKKMTDRDRIKENAQKFQMETTRLLHGENGNHESTDERMDLGKDQRNGVFMAEQNVKDNAKAPEDRQHEHAGKGKGGNVSEASESGEKLETEKWQDAEDGLDEEAGKEQEKGDKGEDKNGDVSPFVSIQETFSGKEGEQVQSRAKRKRPLKPNEQDSNISSSESTNEHNEDDLTKQSVGSSEALNSRRANPTIGSKKRKSTAAGATEKKKRHKNDKRKRLLWTPEEEEMLRVGVEKFSEETRKKFPWRKVLEMGVNVFHETRSPMDLKDKWRNMTWKR